MRVTHDGTPVTVQLHVPPIESCRFPVPPAAVADTEPGVTVAPHPAPLWLTVTVWPAMVTVPVRDSDEMLAPAVTLAVPLPVPVAPADTRSHSVEADDVHVQPVPVVTATANVSPAAGEVRVVGATEYVQPVTGVCVTVSARPPMNRDPVRVNDHGLEAMLNATVPEPVPSVGDVTVSHEAVLTTLHEHESDAVIVTLLEEPTPPAEMLSGDSVAHPAVVPTVACVNFTD